MTESADVPAVCTPRPSPVRRLLQVLDTQSIAGQLSNQAREAVEASNHASALVSKLQLELEKLQSRGGEQFNPRDDLKVKVVGDGHEKAEKAEKAEMAEKAEKAISRESPSPPWTEASDEASQETPVAAKTSNASQCGRIMSNVQRHGSTLTLRTTWIEEVIEDISQSIPPPRRLSVVSKLTLNHSSHSMINAQSKLDRGIVHPMSLFPILWGTMAIILVLYDLIMSPMMAFDIPRTGFSVASDTVILLFWSLDVVVTCSTAIYMDGTLVSDRRAIIRRYLRTWLAFDLLVLLPEYVSFAVSHKSIKFATTLHLFRLFRLFRMFKLYKMFRLAEDRLNSNFAVLVLGILRFAVFFLLMNHWLACIWYAVGNSTPEGWVSYYFEADSGMDSGIVMRYLVALHWASSQFTSSMEVDPRNRRERLMAIMSVLMAVLLASVFIGIVTNMMMQLVLLKKGKVRYQRSLRSFIRHYQISGGLALRIRKYLDACYDGEPSSEYQRKLLLQLPSSMLTDVHEESRAPMLRRHLYFHFLQDAWPQTMRMICHEAIDQFNVVAGDVVFSADDACSRMLFVDIGKLGYRLGVTRTTRGTSDRRMSQNSVTSTLANSDRMEEPVVLRKFGYICEAALWVYWSNVGQLSALTDASLMALHVDDFTRAMNVYEAPFHHACRYADKFLRLIGQIGASDLTVGDFLRV
mmetsp:Transcript_64289/g.139909  ORF Transcript_64289/g.139909 Transcript_64289/m.139909 type:complete len:692 (-) Transcript_64289:30-2105(-)